MRPLVILNFALLLLLSGCSGSMGEFSLEGGSANDLAGGGGSVTDGGRPSTGAEGLPGYIIIDAKVSIAPSGKLLLVQAPSGTFQSYTGDPSSLQVAAFYSTNQAVAKLYHQSEQDAELPAVYQTEAAVNADGSASFTLSGSQNRPIVLALGQTAGSDSVSITNRDDKNYPMYEIYVNQQGSYDLLWNVLDLFMDLWNFLFG